jgi:ATP-dependent DNA helicase RecQ
VLAGRDVMAVMPTGSGKSLCYQLPALLMDGITVVVSPLIALMKDQVDGLQRNQAPATFINSALSLAEQQQRLRQVRRGDFKLLYVAPERFRNRQFMDGLRECKVSLFAVDEAHCVSEWGHDFRPDYLRLKPVFASLGHPPVAAFTATATPEVRQDISLQLGLNQPEVFVTGFDRPNLQFAVRQTSGEDDKIQAILALLRKARQQRGIIYCATRKAVERVTQTLKDSGFQTGAYHAGLPPEQRKSIQDRFMTDQLRIVVATNAFGMGIDKPDLRFIVHYDVPGSLEAYYQEVGRAGRDGQPATCLLLFNFGDTYTQEFFIDNSNPPRELIEEVYEALCEAGGDEIEMTNRELAEAITFPNASELGVSAALKILEKAGLIERGVEGEHEAAITLRSDPAELQASLAERMNQPREILKYLIEVEGLEKDQTLSCDLTDLCEGVGFSIEQTRRALQVLHTAGQIAYRPPFRGRGQRILQRIPADRLPIDFAAISRRSQFERRKLRKMIDYAYSSECLRRFILEYFGESRRSRSCHNCSSCLESGEPLVVRLLNEEETIVVKKVLSCVARMKGRFGAKRVVEVLTGSKAKALEEWNLMSLSTYGILKELSQGDVMEVVKALLDARLLEFEGSEFRVIKLTEGGHAAMTGKVPVEMAFPLTLRPLREAARAVQPAAVVNDVPFHQGLFEELRSLRRKMADEAGLAPFMIFPDEVLKEISRQLPSSPQELLQVRGIGKLKLQKWGGVVLETVRDFRQRNPAENEIQSAARKSHGSTVEETWRLWEQGKNLFEIADARDLTRSTVVGHLLQLMAEGRPIDLERVITPERRKMIETAIAQGGHERLKPIKELLPEEVSYEDIRLVVGALTLSLREKDSA